MFSSIPVRENDQICTKQTWLSKFWRYFVKIIQPVNTYSLVSMTEFWHHVVSGPPLRTIQFTHLLWFSVVFLVGGTVTAGTSASRCRSALRWSTSRAGENTSLDGEVTGVGCCFSCSCCCCCCWCFRCLLCRWCFPPDFVCSWLLRPPSPVWQQTLQKILACMYVPVHAESQRFRWFCS